MHKKHNWLKTAIESEQNASTAYPQDVTNGSEQDGESQDQQGTPSPAPTPTAQEKVQQRLQQDKNQQIKVTNAQEIIPVVAQEALGQLNQAMSLIGEKLASIDELNLPRPAANSLAIEIVAEWVAASRNGTVSDLGGVILKSKRINQILSQM